MMFALPTDLLTLDDWTLRVHLPPGPGPHPVMLLLHGWSGNEDVMWVFANRISPRYLMIAPRAPYETPRGGYGWQPSLNGSWPLTDDLLPAARSLLALLNRLVSHPRLSSGNYRLFDVMGFSQGAAVTAALALAYPRSVRAFALLAGFVPEDADAFLPARPLEGKSVFAAHGTEDRLVPVERARQGVRLLEQAGAQVTYCEDRTGHKLSARCARSLADFWAQRGEKILARKPPS